MSKNIEGKKQIVEEIKEKINASKSVVLADYNKLTVLEVTALRNKFRAANCEYKVYKNTLVRKAFNELGVTDFDNDLNGTTATVFCADETSGASIFAKAVKENPALADKIAAKAAYLDNRYLGKEDPFQGSAYREDARLPAVVQFQIRLRTRFHRKSERGVNRSAQMAQKWYEVPKEVTAGRAV